MRVMISGFSNVGKELTSLLSKNNTELGIDEIFIIDKKKKQEDKVSVANELTEIKEISSMLQNSKLEITYRQVNYRDVSGLEKVLLETRPDIIVITDDSERTEFLDSTPFRAAFTPFVIPNIYNLLKAKSNLKLESKVINTILPSWVNHLLVNEGFDVECGAGELDLKIPQIKSIVSRLYKIDYDKFRVNCIGSMNFRNENFYKEMNESNFKLSVTVTEKPRPQAPFRFSPDKEFSEVFKEYSRTTFRISNNLRPFIYDKMCATGCFKIIKLMLSKSPVSLDEGFMCLPGVLGGLGNTPCYVENLNRSIGRIQLSKEFSPSEDHEINCCGIFDEGLVDIKDTRLNFRSDLIKFMKDKYSLNYPKFLEIKDCEDFILDSQFENFEHKYLLDLT